MAQIGLPVTRDGCGHHVMAHGIFTLIEEPMDPPLFSSSRMSASRARSACRLVLPSTVWNVLTTSLATESVLREDRLPSVAVSPSLQTTAGVGKVLHLHFLPLGFQQPFLTDIVTAKVTDK